ncbi:nuclear receptor binding SET domain protein-like [Anopheles ziemanni]|uniref:nuclear receptor binding SET domain protein-like n=1 Tax=Anopheles ziemanni TaxID=345580 RepID=UPI002659C01F|nr:nuclear receptor binding SET domain protein-like isoform X1 [Anopheles coustani]XP_058175534.1 nuclear receptor binding SET domain protein-like [Anopheles ziemanni]
MHLDCTTAQGPTVHERGFKCSECKAMKDSFEKQSCFVCNDEREETKTESKNRCIYNLCARQYHITCLCMFPQYKAVIPKIIICPLHVCHTCAHYSMAKASHARAKLVRCIKCPSAYHPDLRCIPAGSEMVTTKQLICPKHSLDQIAPHVNWCYLCSKGGDLVCCETCPNTVHQGCLPHKIHGGRYFCKECVSGRFPLHNEIVMAKLGNYRWWPALILPPSKVSEYLFQRRPRASSICVKFFQSHNVAWLNRRRMYLYHNSENLGTKKTRTLDKKYNIAIDEARSVYKSLQTQKMLNVPISSKTKKLAPMFTILKTNRYVLPLKRRPICIDSYCDCRPDDADPCGPTSLCINRITMIECIPSTCPAKDRCLNQRFAKRHYQSLEVRDFEEKGHGLVASESITYGKFIIEYVGEVIDRNELNRRVKENRQNTNYFLRIDHLMTIDAGQKGNVSRFINHSCNPNCKMQKWNVGYAPAIGLFATKDIKAGEELTVNYNSKYFASMKQECRCGSSKCSGYIK